MNNVIPQTSIQFFVLFSNQMNKSKENTFRNTLIIRKLNIFDINGQMKTRKYRLYAVMFYTFIYFNN